MILRPIQGSSCKGSTYRADRSVGIASTRVLTLTAQTLKQTGDPTRIESPSEAERGGFSPGNDQNLLESLQLWLKSLSSEELERVRTLLIAHGFLLS